MITHSRICIHPYTFVVVRLKLYRSNFNNTLFLLSVSRSELKKFDVFKRNFKTNTLILFDQLLLILSI